MSGKLSKALISKHAVSGNPKYRTYLYSGGDEKSALTGGWSKTLYDAGTTYIPTLESTYILGDNSLTSWGSRFPVNMISLAGVNKLKCIMSKDSCDGSGTGLIIVCSSASTWADQDSHVVAQQVASNLSAYSGVMQELKIDVSSLTSTYYIGFKSNGPYKVHSLWLE